MGQFLTKVHADPVELAELLLSAVGEVLASTEEDVDGHRAAWMQALNAAALLLDLLPDARAALQAQGDFGLLDVVHRAIMPAMRHTDMQV